MSKVSTSGPEPGRSKVGEPALWPVRKLLLPLSLGRDGERQSMSAGGAERREDTESEAGSRPRAVGTEPDAEGLNPRIARS